MTNVVMDRPLSSICGVNSGLFRTVLAGRGGTLTDAFDKLERSYNAVQVNRHARRDLLGARMPVDSREGEGHWQLTRMGSNVYVIVENLTYTSTRTELVPGDDLLQFTITLSGDLTIETGGLEPLRVNRPSLLVWRQPRGINLEEWTAAGVKARLVAITVDRRYLAEEFFGGKVSGPLASFLEDGSRNLQYCQMPLTPQMFDLATRLVDSKYSGTMGLIFTEAVTQELLCLAISMLPSRPLEPPALAGLTERQVRCLHTARTLLMRQMSPAPTIREVARVAGINETSLKRGFKLLFGETLFDFSVRHRMEHAMRLLTDRKLPVSHIAEAVGYVHQTSFATAFRRQFGICPKKVRTEVSHC